jgi:hypothetical protein
MAEAYRKVPVAKELVVKGRAKEFIQEHLAATVQLTLAERGNGLWLLSFIGDATHEAGEVEAGEASDLVGDDGYYDDGYYDDADSCYDDDADDADGAADDADSAADDADGAADDDDGTSGETCAKMTNLIPRIVRVGDRSHDNISLAAAMIKLYRICPGARPWLEAAGITAKSFIEEHLSQVVAIEALRGGSFPVLRLLEGQSRKRKAFCKDGSGCKFSHTAKKRRRRR